MAAATPSGTTASVIRRTSATVPKIAGKIPPSVMPPLGALDRNSHVIPGRPWITMSPRMMTTIARMSRHAKPVRLVNPSAMILIQRDILAPQLFLQADHIGLAREIEQEGDHEQGGTDE